MSFTLPSLPSEPLRRVAAGVAAMAMLAALPACGSSDTASTSPSPTASSGASTGATVELQDPYVKAEKATGEMSMSAIFGTLNNASKAEVSLVKATSDAAELVELHEMSMVDGEMKMQPKEGGFVVPAGGTLELKPGGLHIMLIGLKQDIRPGDTVTATLEMSDGSTITTEAIARDMANAQESYSPEGSTPSEK